MCIAERTEEMIVIICEEFLDIWNNSCKRIDARISDIITIPIINNKDINRKIAEILLNEIKANEIYNFRVKIRNICVCTRYTDRFFIPIAIQEGRTIEVRGSKYPYRTMKDLLQDLMK